MLSESWKRNLNLKKPISANETNQNYSNKSHKIWIKKIRNWNSLTNCTMFVHAFVSWYRRYIAHSKSWHIIWLKIRSCVLRNWVWNARILWLQWWWRKINSVLREREKKNEAKKLKNRKTHKICPHFMFLPSLCFSQSSHVSLVCHQCSVYSTVELPSTQKMLWIFRVKAYVYVEL